MIATLTNSTSQPAVRDWQSGFLELLPQIRAQLRYAFRGLRSEAREDAEAEAVAAAMVAYQRLAERGKTDLAYAGPLALYAVAHYRAGRRVGCRWSTTDVMSMAAKKRRGFEIHRFATRPQAEQVCFDGLVETKRASPADVAGWRLDLAQWLRSLGRRDRAIAVQLAVGERTRDVARRFGLSAARISQCRRSLFRSWLVLHGELSETDVSQCRCNDQRSQVTSLASST